MYGPQNTQTETPRTGTPPVVWMTTRQMADRLQLAPKTLCHLARAGRVPHIRVGHALRFRAEQVEQALLRT